MRRLALALLLGGLAWWPVAAQDGVPRNLVVSQPAGALAESQLNLRWDPIPGALGYEVLRKRNGSWWLNEDDPNCIPITNSTSITGLSPDTTFEFCVRAVLAKGVSPVGPAISGRTLPMGTAPVVRKAGPTAPLPGITEPAEEPTPSRPTASLPVRNTNLDPDKVPTSGSVIDLVPPPPKPKPPVREEKPKGPPPPAPLGVMGLFTGTGDIRLSWRPVAEATGYLVEEERDGKWVSVEEGVISENRPSLVVKGRSGAGPYVFRVRSVRYGLRSSESLPTKVER